MAYSIHGLCRSALALTLFAGSAAPADAQFRAPADPATGEKYHVEAMGALWNATPTIVISSESLGIPGSLIDLTADLGLEKKRLPEFRLVLRPATKHKFRFSYLPIKYDTQSTVQRVFVFNGLEYPVGLPVNTVADLTTIRIGYEYDFIYLDRGFFGVLLDLKYTDVNVQLNSPIGSEFTTAVAPLPTIGVVGRGYVAPNVSITGEVSYFRVPESLGREEFGGRYLDFDFYGTVNFNDYVGVQTGYRSIHVDYFLDLDTGDLKFKGMYFAGVLRF